MWIYTLTHLIELRLWILTKIPFGEFLTSGEYELKVECKVCYLQFSKGEMECTTVSFVNLWSLYIKKYKDMK